MIISYTRFCSGMFRVFRPPSTCTIRCRGRHLISLICWLPTSKPKILIPFFLIGQRSGPYAYRNSEAPRPWEAVVGAAWIGQAVRQNYGVVGLLLVTNNLIKAQRVIIIAVEGCAVRHRQQVFKASCLCVCLFAARWRKLGSRESEGRHCHGQHSAAAEAAVSVVLDTLYFFTNFYV